MKYWLIKSEPEEYSIDRLERERSTWWDGVRNYQARNFMTQSMQVGDLMLFYHSNSEPPGVAGIARVKSSARPDAFQFDKKSAYFDPKSKRNSPTWHCVEIAFERRLKRLISLADLRAHPGLSEMLLLKRGQRLSIQPVTEQEFNLVLAMDESPSLADSRL